MKGTESKLVSYMQGSDKRFVIPVYQRNYDWKTENCKQLYDDLVKVAHCGRKNHFFGSIVSVHNEGAFNEYLVIDGQQRLTTISLLLLAMYNLMKNGVLAPEKSNLAEKIYKTYLIDEWQDDETRIKLKPIKNDRKAFEKLFDKDAEQVPDSNLTINYNYFYSRIQKEEITLDELYEAVTKLEIINITLNQDDNPQLIFESLNSTGVALSEGDKIRNFILMGLPTKQQDVYYEKYWNKIEFCTNYNVSVFVRDYLSVKQQLIPSMSKVYITFKAYVDENGTETEPLLQELSEYAKWYEILLKGNTADKELNACISRLNRLETTVTRPFFLEILNLQATEKLSLSEVKEIFLYTENYLFRRMICSLPTNALNKIFLMLHREIIRYDGTDANYLEKFKYALASKSDRGRFPSDGEFIGAFAIRPIYQMNSKNKIYILERFENYGTVEVQNIYKACDDGILSIEHIMPQHLTPAWVEELGENYKEIHETWLHRMSNLTLTGYNSKYSNSVFSDKRDMQNGFLDSHLYLNKWVGQQNHWGLAELEARNKMLMQRALMIWPLPATDFKPAEKKMDSYSLDDDVDLSGRNIIRFSYKNTEQPVTSWIDMMERVLKILHAEDKSVLSHLAYSKGEANDLDAYVSYKTQDLREALEIDTNIYVERNTSTTTKISILRKLFKAYGAHEEDLIFYLKNANDNETASTEVVRGKVLNQKTERNCKEEHTMGSEQIKNQLQIVQGDITKLDCDCIVNAANRSLLGGGGVDGAIHRAAGPELLAECRTLHGCRTGEAKITKGYRLKAKYIIHTVGPIYSGTPEDAVQLTDCYRNSLELAKACHIHSIAFPAISAGAYGYPLDAATKIAVDTVADWLQSHADYDMKVIFCCFDARTAQAYQTEIGG